MSTFSSGPGASRGKLRRWRYNISLRRNAFCLWKPNNTAWHRECVYPTNSSLISGLPCMRVNKLPSYEVCSSVARYVCLPTRKTFHVWGACQWLLVKCTWRYVWSMCICVGVLNLQRVLLLRVLTGRRWREQAFLFGSSSDSNWEQTNGNQGSIWT